MKITLISYDFFGYDKHIITALQKRGIETTHIDLNHFHFEYSGKFEKIKNFFSKLLFKRNIKELAVKKFIFDTLNKTGYQDKILVIRPDLISKKTHLAIKKNTKDYICYIYDSCNRFKVKHLFKGIFKRIYSYDLEDSKIYNLIPLTNYMYFDRNELYNETTDYDAFTVMSPDERLSILTKIALELDQQNLRYKFMVISNQKPENLLSTIEHDTKRVSTYEVINLMEKSKVIIDLIRKDHNGLSFRIFETMALQKKIITTNKSVAQYDFFNPKNILIIDESNITINNTFFSTSYVPLDSKIFEKYTIKNWVDTVFKI